MALKGGKKPRVAVAIFCPRCDRKFSNKNDKETYARVMKRVIIHVDDQHPDHDPYWYETYPEDEEKVKGERSQT